jgi:superfamily II DNA or RNA helicase
MVSEGVDVPRLRVGVYATTARTELFFRQVVGRFVRRTPAPREQMSHLFLASDPRLKQLAAQVEEERNHALVQEAQGEAVAEQRERAEATEAFRALWSSARRDDDVLRTTAPGDALQLFADAAPEPAAPPAALAAFTTTTATAPSRPAAESAHERRERLRDQRRALVAAVSRRTGEAHRAIHGRINRETGAASVTAASVDQLERGNRLLERQVAKRR